MAAPTRANCQPNRESLEGAGVVAGWFQTFNVHGPFPTFCPSFLVNFLGADPHAFRQQIANAFPVADHLSQFYCGFSIAKPKRETFRVGRAGEIFIGQNASFVAFHRIPNRHAHADGVHPVVVRDCDQLDGGADVRNAKVGAVREQAFILNSGHGAGERSGFDNGHLLTRDGALRASNYFDLVVFIQKFATDLVRVFEHTLCKVTRGQNARLVLTEQTSSGSVNTIFFSVFALRGFGDVKRELI